MLRHWFFQKDSSKDVPDGLAFRLYYKKPIKVLAKERIKDENGVFRKENQSFLRRKRILTKINDATKGTITPIDSRRNHHATSS